MTDYPVPFPLEFPTSLMGGISKNTVWFHCIYLVDEDSLAESHTYSIDLKPIDLLLLLLSNPATIRLIYIMHLYNQNRLMNFQSSFIEL
jgi:hypothetical protein